MHIMSLTLSRKALRPIEYETFGRWKLMLLWLVGVNGGMFICLSLAKILISIFQLPWKLHLPNSSTFSPMKCLKSSMVRLHSSEIWSQAIFSQISQTLLTFLSQVNLASFTAVLALSKAFLAAWRPLISSCAALFDSSSKPVSMIDLAWKPVSANGFP